MNRSRSVSRRPSTRHRDDSVSPARSQPHPPSTVSSYSPDRSRSQSRGTPACHRRQQHGPSSTASSGLSKSAGVLAGIGIAALVARKLWPKSSNSSSGTAAKEDRGPRRHSSTQEAAPHGRDVDRRAHRQASNASSHDQGYERYATRGEESSYYLREPRRKNPDQRSWGGEEARSYTQSSIGHGRRCS